MKIILDREKKLVTAEQVAGRSLDIQVGVSTESLLPEAELFLRFIETYLQESDRSIQGGETMAYGYWLVKFIPLARNTLAVWEYADDGAAFVCGASRTLTYWRDQHAVCAQVGAVFSPPRPDQLIVLDPGVMHDSPVQGVRYPSPAHMSGWWITSTEYDGNISTLRREHTYHLSASRPDLAAYLALPFGFRFDTSIVGRPWFEEEVARQGP